MDMNENQGEPQEYTIKIIPQSGETVHSFRLSARLLKYGLASLGTGALLLAGAFGYAVYSTFAARSDAAEIEGLRQVNTIQQEQLLQLSKKANALQDEMDQLTQKENELRRISGATPADAGDEKGQGGPYAEADAEHVGAALGFLEKSLAVRKGSLDRLQAELKTKRETYASLAVPGMLMGIGGSTVPSIWPATGEVSSPYGLRWGGTDFHPGMDIANDMGTPIVATADGTVVVAGWNSGGYGNMVDIDHGNGIMTRYGHASQVVVTAGQRVRRGQLIAYMGSTGFSTGPHVHYEVHVDGRTVNPVSYL